jgi:hypothetical protein|tara:strand:+ start:139 stop:1080 length:942 start_codon:yes stop_codon:yes gene_type:complete
MGQALSKHPIRETVLGVSIIAGLSMWLEQEVNLPHNPKDAPAPVSPSTSPTTHSSTIEQNFLKNKPAGMTRNNLSFASLNRLERLQRAVELKRSVPRSYKMAAMSFAKCFMAIGILDLTMARRFKARFFALHALTNAIVTTKAFKDGVIGIYDPMRGMEGPCNVVPAYMILTLFIYHVTMFKNVPYDEWWHHILFGVGIGGVGLHYCPGPLQNALCFFISGFPGGVDYAMLALIKDGLMKPKTEKLVNGWMNAWVRGPGLTMVGFAMYLAAKYGRTSMPTWAAAFCGALSWFNGNYYAARVVASAGSNGWRPS